MRVQSCTWARRRRARSAQWKPWPARQKIIETINTDLLLLRTNRRRNGMLCLQRLRLKLRLQFRILICLNPRCWHLTWSQSLKKLMCLGSLKVLLIRRLKSMIAKSKLTLSIIEWRKSVKLFQEDRNWLLMSIKTKIRRLYKFQEQPFNGNPVLRINNGFKPINLTSELESQIRILFNSLSQLAGDINL